LNKQKKNNDYKKKHVTKKTRNKKYRHQLNQSNCNISILVFLISLVFCYLTYFVLCIFQMFINILSNECYFIIFIIIIICILFYKLNNISVKQVKNNE
jgi:hypothetical protein